MLMTVAMLQISRHCSIVAEFNLEDSPRLDLFQPQ